MAAANRRGDSVKDPALYYWTIAFVIVNGLLLALFVGTLLVAIVKGVGSLVRSRPHCDDSTTHCSICDQRFEDCECWADPPPTSDTKTDSRVQQLKARLSKICDDKDCDLCAAIIAYAVDYSQKHRTESTCGVYGCAVCEQPRDNNGIY